MRFSRFAALGVAAFVSAILPPSEAHAQTAVARTQAVVPRVVGMQLDSAVKVLMRFGLAVVQVESVTTAAPRGIVVLQRPNGGTPLSATKTDTVYWAVPRRRPSVATMATSVVSGVLTPSKPPVSTTPPPAPTATDVNPGVSTTVPLPGTKTPVPGVVVVDDTYVPRLYGHTENEVTQLLERFRLKLGQVGREYSTDVTVGRVVRQHPEASKTRVARGTAVDVWYSNGPPPPAGQGKQTMPNVVGLSLRAATDSLRRVRLRVAHIDTTFERRASGLVSSQEPHAGSTVGPRSAIELTVALPSPLISVPPVLKLSRRAAQATLQKAGLDLGRVTLVAIIGADTVIVSQQPEAGTEVARGTLVDVVENRPPVKRRAAVPDLTGATRDEAKARLLRDSLFLGTVTLSDDSESPRVVAQAPRAGDSAYFYSEVNITLRGAPAGPRPVEPVAPRETTATRLIPVPFVVNLTTKRAREILSDSGLTHIAIRGDASTPGSLVVSQQPEAGAMVRESAVVALLVSAQLPPVPSLVGQRESAARADAEHHQFSMQVISRRRVLRWRDEVVSQSPPALSVAPPDAAINVDVEIPVVPPIPAMIALVIGAVGDGVRRRFKSPPTQVALHEVVTSPEPPVVEAASSSLIAASVVLRYAIDDESQTIDPREISLIQWPDRRNG